MQKPNGQKEVGEVEQNCTLNLLKAAFVISL